MKLSTLRSAIDGPLRIVIVLVALALVLGIAAYVPTWHGNVKTLLRLSFWGVASLAVLIFPFVTRGRGPT